MQFYMNDENDLTVRRFSTAEFSVEQRVARWREEFGRTVVRVDVEPTAPDADFKAEAVLQILPGVRLAQYSGSEARLNRTRALASDGGDTIGLIVNLGASAMVTQRGRDLTLGRGEAVFVRPDEAGALTGETHLNLLFPRAALALRTSDLIDRMMVPIVDNSPPMTLLLGYLKFVQSLENLGQPAVQQTIASHIHDLAALITNASDEVQHGGRGAVAAARFAAAVDHIGKSFTDPALSLAGVAGHLGISQRYLQELLERSGTPFTARVTELRLNRAFALLVRYPDRAISDIAARAGFANVSHFNRQFRRRFGETPSNVRGSD
jgi:AraC-like DNA-binding protein